MCLFFDGMQFSQQFSGNSSAPEQSTRFYRTPQNIIWYLLVRHKILWAETLSIWGSQANILRNRSHNRKVLTVSSRECNFLTSVRKNTLLRSRALVFTPGPGRRPTYKKHRIYDDLWWSMMIYDDLWWFMMIYDDLWRSMTIYHTNTPKWCNFCEHTKLQRSGPPPKIIPKR